MKKLHSFNLSVVVFMSTDITTTVYSDIGKHSAIELWDRVVLTPTPSLWNVRDSVEDALNYTITTEE